MPPGVWTRGGRERSSRVMGERSKIRTPRSSATRRSPRASNAGWTVAPDCSSTPARWVGDPARRATSSGSSRSKTCSPWRSMAATVSSQAPICAALVAAHSQPSWRKCASMPFAVQKPPIASTAPAEARQSRSASSAPTMCSSFANFAHQESTKPPLRPLGPPPQTSPSTSTTSSAGSCSLSRIAVHRPV